MTIEEEVKDVIANCLAIESESIKNDHKFKEDLGADSLDIADIAFRLEKRFNKNIRDDDLKSVQDVINVLGTPC